LPMPKKSAKRKPAAKKQAASTRTDTRQPVASRPVMPARYGVSQSVKGLLDWNWAQERLTNSHNYVIVTVRPDGRPHAMGMHGLWFEDAFYFHTGETTRKARNLAVNPNCILVTSVLRNWSSSKARPNRSATTRFLLRSRRPARRNMGGPTTLGWAE